MEKFVETLSDQFKNLLIPFESLSEYIQNDIFAVSNLFVNLDIKKIILINKQKEFRKHMDNKYKIQYQQFSIVKTIPRNHPYQRRIY